MGKRKYTSSMESNIRLLRREPEINPKYLIFTRKISGELEGIDEYLTYNPELEKILMLDCLRPYRNNGYLKFKVSSDGAETRFTIYDLAYGCYSGIIHYDTYLEDIQRFFEYKHFHDYVIDHADGIITNHTVNNLSLMTSTENKQKLDVVSRVKLPARLSVAFVDGKYRVCLAEKMANFHKLGMMLNQLGLPVCADNAVATMCLICDCPESLVNCLRYISNAHIEGCVPIKTEKGQWRKEGECWFENIARSLESQSIIAQMNDAAFDKFEPLKST